MSVTSALFAPLTASAPPRADADLAEPTLIIGDMLVNSDSEPGESAADPIAPFARAAAREHDGEGFYDAMRRGRQSSPHASFATYACTGRSCSDQSLTDY